MKRSEQIQAAIDKITNRKAVSLSTRALMTEAAEWADANPSEELATLKHYEMVSLMNESKVDRLETKLAIAVKALEHYAAKMGKKAVEALAEIKKH